MFEANINTKIRTFATFSDFNRILTLFKKCFGGQNNLAGSQRRPGEDQAGGEAWLKKNTLLH